MQNLIPIVVDLDETLARTDFFYESLLVFVKKNPFNLIKAIWLLITQGKAQLKSEICKSVNIKPELIPYNHKLIDWIKQKKAKGHQLILATATHKSIAESVNEHLGLFDLVLATDENQNLKGLNKRNKLVELYGEKQFTYVGDSYADLKVWPSAYSAVVINPSDKLLKEVQAVSKVETVIAEENSPDRFFKAIRIHQWVKNFLVFVPLFTSHNLTDGQLVFRAAIAFLAFSLCASAIYIINDLFDLQDDRQHRSKYKRPFASGQMSIIKGVLICIVCLLLSMLLGLYLGADFLGVIIVYLLITLLYSLYFKFVVMLDIVVLAGLYTIRILAGAVAINVELSSWLLAYSMFIFLSLAIMKRYTELYGLKQQGRDESFKSRGYLIKDMQMLAIIGSASGYISVLVMALFINSLSESNLYARPALLWWVCPLLLFWIGRVWLLAGRGGIDDDPIYYVIRDKISWVLGIIVIVLFLAASS